MKIVWGHQEIKNEIGLRPFQDKFSRERDQERYIVSKRI